MPWQKRVADGLTLSRVFLAAMVIGVGIQSGSDGIQAVLVLLLIAATFDTLDGYFARQSQSTDQTWIGAHDLEFDLLFSTSLLVYLVLSGTVPLVLGAAHFVFWMWVFARSRTIPNSYAILFQAPMYAAMAIAAGLDNPPTFLYILLWLAVMFAFARRRFLAVRLPRLVQDFHRNVVDIFSRHRARG